MADPREEKRRADIKSIISREYRIFKEDELLASVPRTLFERACQRSGRILKVSVGGKSGSKMQEAIDFSHLNVTPGGVVAFAFLFAVGTLALILGLVGLAVVGIHVLDGGMGLLLMIIALFFTYYLYSFPFHLRRKYEVDLSGDMVTMILYMAMFMRNVPSLEGAVRFAGNNIGGYMGYELRKMLWDVEVGTYLSMQDALLAYTKKWERNREFVESVELMITSLSQIGDKRIAMLDESVNLILEGTRERAKNFNQQLKLPVMVVHALGVILPVMGLVLFPIVSIFLKVGAAALFIGYDIILPLVLYFIIVRILEARPLTFSRIDITENPDVPPKGKFFWGKKAVRAWPVALLAGATIIAIGMVLLNAERGAAIAAGTRFEGIVPALVITFGIAFGPALYFILLARTRSKVRTETRRVESEFAEALFQLGSQISGGTPLEVSIERSMDRIDNLRIKDLFAKALNNMKMLGYTFHQAFFDPTYGAVRMYPSKMIKSIINTVFEASKKGVNTAAQAMMSVSRYLKGLHSTQEDVKEQLSDTLNSLKFQGYFLSPLISGIIVTMAIIIIQILQELNVRTAAFGQNNAGLGDFGALFGGVTITPFEFIAVVGVYLIESSLILAFFVSQIESGDDETGFRQIAGSTLLVGYIIFLLIFAASYVLFAPLISQVVA